MSLAATLFSSPGADRHGRHHDHIARSRRIGRGHVGRSPRRDSRGWRAPGTAAAFWSGALAAAERGERIVFGAWDGDAIVATVTLLLDLPPNQPHRAEIAKMMTRVSHRGRGIATALLRAAEAVAIEKGRILLVLDTARDEGAAGLYERLGYTLTGEIPDYALKPHGGLSGTLIYWKRLRE